MIGLNRLSHYLCRPLKKASERNYPTNYSAFYQH